MLKKLTNLSLKVKLIGGFALVAIITLVVGMIGYHGVDMAGDQIESLANDHLPGIENILRVKGDFEAIIAVQMTLLNPLLTQEERQKQYDHLAKAREDYQRAFKNYEALPKTEEQKKLWQDLVKLTKDWKTENDKFLQLSRDLDQSCILNPQALMETLEGIRAGHVYLRHRCLSLIHFHRTFEGGGDPTACKLGQWLREFKTCKPELMAVMEQIKPVHNRFHEAVTRIKQLVDHGDLKGAEAVYVNDLRPAGDEISQRLDDLTGMAAGPEKLYRQMTQIVLDISNTKQAEGMALLDKLIKIENKEATAAKEEGLASESKAKHMSLMGMSVGFALALALGILLSLSITRPLARTMEFVKRMGEGDFSQKLTIDRQDEVGQLAQSMNQMVDQLGGLLKNLTEGVATLSSSATELEAISGQMTTGTAQTSSRAATVAAAAEEMSVSLAQVATTAEQASNNVTVVAAATEEMSATVQEIAHNSEKARIITAQAVSQAAGANQTVDQLGQAAREIGKITETITEISEQTNLLALNATIEAARAGEAGKGFAVVAGEIKDLAQQTAKATEEIRQKIHMIQQSIGGTVAEIGQVSGVIQEVMDIVASTAAAVEEQATTTREIAGNVSQVSVGVQAVTTNVAQSSSAAGEVAKEIAMVDQAAGDMATAGSQVNLSAGDLSKLAERLHEMVSRFHI